jgi:hypothetical protein
VISERLEALAQALVRMREKAPLIAVKMPVRLINTSNSREHWRATAKRAKTVRHTAKVMTRSAIVRSIFVRERGLIYDTPSEVELRYPDAAKALREMLNFGRAAPLDVRLVYVGPRELDYDGVWSAVKSMRDGVADALGIDDGDPRVVWVPDHERGGVREYGARVEIYLA